METKTYIVSLKEGIDYNQFWTDIENPTSGLPYIPNRAVRIVNDRPIFDRICEYELTDDEAERVRNDPRVYAIEQPSEDLPYVEVGPAAVQTGNFSKPTSISNSANSCINWGLIRHNNPTNLYATTTNLSYTHGLDGTNVDVLISDSGVQVDHPEFTNANGVSRVIIVDWDGIATQIGCTRTSGWNSVSYKYGTDSVVEGHGTHVAGIVAGKTYGWAKNANIISLGKIFDGTYPIADVFSLIKYWHVNKPINPVTGQKNPTVMNMSWGQSFGKYNSSQINLLKSAIQGGTYQTDPAWSTNGIAQPDTFYQQKGLLLGSDSFSLNSLANGIPYRDSTYDVIMQELLSNKVIICKSAMNTSYKKDIPGGKDYNNTITVDIAMLGRGTGTRTLRYHRGAGPTVPGVIEVGNIDSANSGFTDQAAASSVKGPGVDIWAAGTSIMSSWPKNALDKVGADYFKQPGQGWQQRNSSGTSMASPQIAGMCALYLQKNPTATPAQVKSWLLKNATTTILNTGTDNDYTNPRSLLGSAPNVAYQNLKGLFYVKDNTGAWKQIKAVWINENGTWKQVSTSYYNINGTWTPTFTG